MIEKGTEVKVKEGSSYEHLNQFKLVVVDQELEPIDYPIAVKIGDTDSFEWFKEEELIINKMNKLDKQYTELLQDIIDNGVVKEDRTGTGTISVFGRQIRHNMSEGFPLLTTKKMPWKTIVTELLWFLRGDTNIKYLVDNGCNIWNGDAYKRYHSTWEMDTYGVLESLSQEQFVEKIKTNDEFAKRYGELGPIYGKQWRKWGTGETVTIGHNGSHTLLGEKVIDQIQNLINDLKTNPDSRRLMVNAWNVGELNQMVLPPCHYGFQVYTRLTTREEKIENPGKYRAISLMWNQRSVDTFLGLPFNIASYGLLLEIIANEVDMIPDQLIGNLGDVHLYSNHIEQAKEQIVREGYGLPTLRFSPCPITGISMEYQSISQFQIDNYQSHPTIKAPLSN
jgi:thymidylate synthase